MSDYWNLRVKELCPYVAGEQPRGLKFIKLNTNENPYPPSAKVGEAVHRVVAGGRAAGDTLRLYPDPACTELRETIAERYHVKPGQVFAGNGSDEVLAFAFGAFFEAGVQDAVPPVLFPDITYSFYPVYAQLWNVPYRTVPLLQDFSINVTDYLVSSGGAALPNPNAPTGLGLSAKELLSIVKYQDREKKVVIIDEAYAAFGAESLVKYIDECPNLLTVHTLSKMASLAGLRCGFAIGNEELIEGLCRVRDSFNSYTLDRLAQAAAAAAISDTAYLEATTLKVIATRDRVSAALAGMGFTVIPSKANFIFASPPNRDAKAFFTSLRENGILVRHFDKPRIAEFMRITIGTDDEMDIFLAVCKDLIT
jgi:histidinol-phosphate aminotransferase